IIGMDILFHGVLLGNRDVYVEREPIMEVRHRHKAAPEGREPLIFPQAPSFRTFPQNPRMPRP
ncbi:MAG TPA: hypothetical protein VED02_00650, partial [Methyloceanibacter sp.]|nr:hypothetical protein [Methyloceanibacter sp.]